MASIICHHHFTSHNIYTVNIDGTFITVTVTATPKVVKNWLYNTLYLRRHHRFLNQLVVGLGVQWTPYGSPNPQADTLQLCVGCRCLIFQLSHADRVPVSLRRFLLDPSHTFVGFWNHSDRKKLRESVHGLEMAMDPIDLRHYAETEDGGDLSGASVSEIIEGCLGYDVEQSREISMSDWDEEFLSREQVMYACVDAHCAFLMGKNCRVWKFPGKFNVSFT